MSDGMPRVAPPNAYERECVARIVRAGRPRLVRDWVHRFVRSTRELRTKGGDVFPVGAVFRVESAWRGRLNLRRIGSHRRIRQIAPAAVEPYVRPRSSVVATGDGNEGSPKGEQ